MRPTRRSSLARPADRVVFVEERLTAYRVPFFDRLRDALAADGLRLEVVYGAPSRDEATRADTGELQWGSQVRNRAVRLGSARAVWQPIVAATRTADLVIVNQASRLLANYLLLGRQRLGGAKIALFGHGANLQAGTERLGRLGEAAKRRYSRLPHWWFAYTDGSADRVRQLGYPVERITVVQNALDTSALAGWYASATPEESRQARAELGVRGALTCLYLGSLYAHKRLEFLVTAGRMIAAQLPDFELVVVGSGPDEDLVRRAASELSWLHHVPARFGRQNALLARDAQLILMPGAVGLVALDAFALQLPLVTTTEAAHGPEAEYLRDEINAILVAAGDDPWTYARTVIDVLTDPGRVGYLKKGCAESADIYTLDEMVRRFAAGIGEALTS